MNQSFQDVLREDLLWYGPATLRHFLRALIRERTFRPVFTLRCAQHSTGLLRAVSRIVHRRVCARAGIDLPVMVSAGPGLKLTHGWGLVVSPGAVIGRDVILMHGVTLGARGGDGLAPVLRDGVFVGPNASILGGVEIGAGATVSAGCVVVDDVPPSTMVTANRSGLLHRPLERPREKGVR